ncbi:hypothetical protein THRCLA_00889 [Thraustotheca clavata]|uniref:Long-chain-alcohol oxidase n=1 Tax=Thraustotheca clavata TaxID=74557 RepID=A0A1W0AAR3_9STRA|nr:hypothetical protein THRCLA_00889 [Thraustotheca clavata]
MDLSDAQLETLSAIIDTFVSPLSSAQVEDITQEYFAQLKEHNANIIPSENDVKQFLTTDPKSLDLLTEAQTQIKFLPKDKQADLIKVFDLLASGWGTYVLTGTRSTPFHQLPQSERETGLYNMAQSRFATVRGIFQAFKGLFVGGLFMKKQTVDGQANPTWAAMGFTGEPENRAPASAFVKPQFEDVQAMAAALGENEPIVIETDVVIVGSGAGGGVVAAELAQAGYRVLVLEKGQYYYGPEDDFNELESYRNKYEQGCLLTSEDNSLILFAGSTWGGGTTVNWSGSFRLPYEVRQEWAKKHNLPYFASPQFEQAFDRIYERLGISDAHLKLNCPNQILIDGCTKLGLPARKIEQTTGGAEHSCGFCTLGCPANEKQGTAVSWLRDAQAAGAKFIQGCFVDKVTYSNDRVATGVEGTVLNGKTKLIVRATTVVASAGSIHTPSLLLRSGLKNKNIGKNHRVHPVVTLNGFFPTKTTRPWSGSILTSVSSALSNINGNGYGASLEVPVGLPGLVSVMLPWRNNVDYKTKMLQIPHLSTVFALVRDYDSVSRIVNDATGQPRVHFQLGPKDAYAMQEGLVTSANIMLSQGAVELNTSHHSLPPLKLTTPEELANPVECAKTQEWIKQLRATGVAQNRTALFNAHQMGSCRMGATPAAGAVNPDGETWEIKGLYVADASLFPTASGVNPMTTTYAISYSVAQFMKANLEQEKTNPSGATRKSFGLSWWQRTFA